jgi:WD40 repeat protein/transcriptional regulator with XRE-family HTH domain
MSYHHRYKQRNFQFAQQLLILRKRANLTQEEVARKCGVGSKSIRNWEGGGNYPTEPHLQKLIELFLDQDVFTPEHEREEARAFWEVFQKSTHRPSALFDEQWFAAALKASQEQRGRSGDVSGNSPSLFSDQQTSPSFPVPETHLLNATHDAGRTAERREDWGEALDVSNFAGRENELIRLERWILKAQSRLVALLGVGGIGKTTLATTVAQQVATQFEVVIWRSLHHAPPLEQLLNDGLRLLMDQSPENYPQDISQQISLLISGLRQRRCLLVLDNVETLFQEGVRAGTYRQGYEDYRSLFMRVGASQHQSCLLLTSRERLPELDLLLGKKAAVHVLKLTGLSGQESQAIFSDEDLQASPEAWQELSERYAGNPLALKIVLGEIGELFGRDIASFLQVGHFTFQSVQTLLQEQVHRLSVLEQELLYWLAIERELVSVEGLQANLLHKVSAGEIMMALSSLRRRSLIERGEHGAVFTLQPVILEYMTDRLTEQVASEILTQRPALLLSYALLRAQAKDYIRSSQGRLILQTVLDRLLLEVRDKHQVEKLLDQLLTYLRSIPMTEQGYGGGNLVNLLARLSGQVKGKDCSRLTIWQADLQEVEAQDVNFSGADLTGSVFLETIETTRKVALSPNGQYVAAGTDSGEICLWHTENGQEKISLARHTHWVWSLAFHPESTILASGGYDGLVKLWEIESGQCLRILQGHTRWIRCIVFHPEGKLLATAGTDKSIRLWDVRTGSCLQLWDSQPAEVWSVVFSPDGRFLAGGDATGIIRLWDLESKQCLWTATASPASAASNLRTVASLAFSPDGSFLVSGGLDTRIRVWETTSGKHLNTLIGHTGSVFSVALDAQGLLASGSQDETMKLWQIGPRGETGQCVGTLQEPNQVIWSVSFGPRGLLASGSQNGTVKLWQVNAEGERIKCLRTLHGYSRLINSIVFSPDGRLLLSSGHSGRMKLWETWSGKLLRTLPRQTSESYALAFSPDGHICTQHNPLDGTIILWDIDSGQSLRILRGPRGFIWKMIFSPDGYFLLSGGLDTMVKLWEVESGRCLTTFEGHNNWVWSLACSPDGTKLASGDTDGMVKLWDLKSERCLCTLQCSTQAILALSFTHHGQCLVSCDGQGQVKRWDTENGDYLGSVSGMGETYWLGSVALNSDGTLLATASSDEVIKVRDTSSGQILHTFKSDAGRPRSVAWSSDQRLACGTDEGSILFWQIPTGQRLLALFSDRPYEHMNISGVTGITHTQKASLKILGAIEKESREEPL